MRVPLSVVIPTKNEHLNIERCLRAIVGWANEIVVVDSASIDNTIQIAKRFGADVIIFNYKGGWPKKRQWALDSYHFRNEWILLLDVDEILDEAIKEEIASRLLSPRFDAYYLRYRIIFLGRQLRHGDTELWKLSLFRRGKAQFECRAAEQDESMCDMEVHEHVVSSGAVGRIFSPVSHLNHNSIARYIEKHNQYSNWEALVYDRPEQMGLPAKLFGNQAQRRRWLKKKMVRNHLFPPLVFMYTYLIRGGFLDGTAGFLYCALKAVQRLHVQVKLYERQLDRVASDLQ